MIEGLEPLLEPAARERAERLPDGAPYLDLLDAELESTGATQDLMRTSFVPQIYERYWRPALGRIAKGIRGPGMAEEIRIARLLLGLGPGDRVLDIASGPGNFSRAFAATVGGSGLVVGFDASRTMLERGAADLRRSGIDNLALIRGDATALPFLDGSFDAVCCFASGSAGCGSSASGRSSTPSRSGDSTSCTSGSAASSSSSADDRPPGPPAHRIAR